MGHLLDFISLNAWVAPYNRYSIQYHYPDFLAGEIWLWENFKIDFALAYHSQYKIANQHRFLIPRLPRIYVSDTDFYQGKNIRIRKKEEFILH